MHYLLQNNVPIFYVDKATYSNEKFITIIREALRHTPITLLFGNADTFAHPECPAHAYVDCLKTLEELDDTIKSALERESINTVEPMQFSAHIYISQHQLPLRIRWPNNKDLQRLQPNVFNCCVQPPFPSFGWTHCK